MPPSAWIKVLTASMVGSMPWWSRHVQYCGVFAGLPPIGRDHQLADNGVDGACLGRPALLH